MKQIIIVLLTSIVLSSCIQDKKADPNIPNDTFATASNDTLSTNQLKPNPTLDCSIFKFENVKQQADSLIKYFDKKDLATDEKFFCAFPNSFKGMQDIFGFDDNRGAAPLYDSPHGQNMIRYFANLNTISQEIYYDKYINICVDGVWEADNIKEAFGFVGRLTHDTEAACSSLSKRSDEEIKSVFHFIFDGPHPQNNENEKIYDELFPIFMKQNERLGKLLKESYNKVIAEDDGHGH